MIHPHLPYAITEVYCIVFAATVWFRLNSSLGSEHEVRQLRNMIYSYFVMLVTDIVWALSEDGIIHIPEFPYAFINAVTVISIACGCYFWFKFLEDRLHFSFASSKTVNTLLKIPVLSLCALDLASVFTGWLFFIDDAGHYQSTSLFWLHTVVNYLYLMVPTARAIYMGATTHSKDERAEYLTYALYMIAPLLAGMLEDVFPLVPLLALNIFMVILIMFLMIQNLQVYNDAITGLNNRRRLNWHLEGCLSKASPERPVTLFIMDINSFKSINDLYGNLEGDHALQAFSTVLKAFAAKYSAFAARYGGDEFCLVMDADYISPEEIAADLQRSLRLAQESESGEQQKYTLTVSVGYTVCDKGESRVDLVLARADDALYQSKARWHADR